MVRRLGVFRWMTMLASRLAKSPGEIWFSLWALGFESSFTTAVILESAALVVRGAAFLVPGAMGVQERGYTFLVIC